MIIWVMRDNNTLRAYGRPRAGYAVRPSRDFVGFIQTSGSGGCTFDPRIPRNDATGNIASDLAELGISLDQETILKWLRQGADILPPDSLGP